MSVVSEPHPETSVAGQLREWALAQFSDDDTRAAAAEIWPAGGGLGLPDNVHALFPYWLIHDYLLQNGKTAAEAFADLPTLSEDERQEAASYAAARLSVYRVVQRAPGSTVDLEPLRGGGGSVRVSSAMVSAQVDQGDFIIGRVLSTSGERPVLEMWGPALVLPPSAELSLVSLLDECPPIEIAAALLRYSAPGP